MPTYLRLTSAGQLIEHLVTPDDYDEGVASGWYRTACWKTLRPAAMVSGPDKTCGACRAVADPVDWRNPRRPGKIERWLRGVSA